MERAKLKRNHHQLLQVKLTVLVDDYCCWCDVAAEGVAVEFVGPEKFSLCW